MSSKLLRKTLSRRSLRDRQTSFLDSLKSGSSTDEVRFTCGRGASLKTKSY